MLLLPFLILMLENPEWLIIALIVVVLFGGSRLGQLGSSLGQGIREFRHAVRDAADSAYRPEDAAPGASSGEGVAGLPPQPPLAHRGDYRPDGPA